MWEQSDPLYVPALFLEYSSLLLLSRNGNKTFPYVSTHVYFLADRLILTSVISVTSGSHLTGPFHLRIISRFLLLPLVMTSDHPRTFNHHQLQLFRKRTWLQYVLPSLELQNFQLSKWFIEGGDTRHWILAPREVELSVLFPSLFLIISQSFESISFAWPRKHCQRAAAENPFSLSTSLRGCGMSGCVWVDDKFNCFRCHINSQLQRGENDHSLIISREGSVLTLSILPCPQGRIF